VPSTLIIFYVSEVIDSMTKEYHNCKTCRTKDPTSVKEMMEFCLKCYEYNLSILN